MDELMTKDEVAAFLKVTRRTVDRYAQYKVIPQPIKLNGLHRSGRRWVRSELVALVERHLQSRG